MAIDENGGGGSAAELLLGGAGGGGEGSSGDGTGDGGGGGGAGDGGPGDGGGAGGADPDWYNELSVDVPEGEKASLRDWVKSVNVKDLNGLAKIARDNQIALRESGRIKVPGEGASDEERAAFNKAIGVPETVDGYTFEAPKDAEGKAVELNGPLLDRLAAAAHKAGMPAEAYKAVVGEFVAAQLEELAGLNAAKQADALEWANSQGDKRAAKLAAVDRGAQAIGLEEGEVLKMRDSFGSQRAMDILARVGEGVGEDVLTGAGGGGSGRIFMNGDQAQAELDKMKADPVACKAMTVKGSPEYARRERLIAIIGEAANLRARNAA